MASALPMVTMSSIPVVAQPGGARQAGPPLLPTPQPTGNPPPELADIPEPEPMTPRQIENWRHAPRVYHDERNRQWFTPVRTHDDMPLPAGKQPLSTSQYTQRGWKYYINPEGVPHFYHPKHRVLTDANLNPSHRPSVGDAFDALEKCISRLKDRRDPSRDYVCDHNEELVLKVYTDMPSNGAPLKVTRCYYYFVCETEITTSADDDSTNDVKRELTTKMERRIFWIHDVPSSVISRDVPGIANLEHLGLELAALYWKHWQQFPMDRTVPPDCVQELQGTLMCYNIDARTSVVSTAPYNSQDLSELSEAVSNITDVGPKGGYGGWTLGRIMYTIYHERFINFHGQHLGRFSSDQRIHEAKEAPRSFFFYLMNVLLFGAPGKQLAELSRILIDHLVNYDHRWKAFMDNTKQDWNNFVVAAAIILASDMAFLAIPDVAGDSGVGSPRSLSEVFGYASVIFSMACIISALFHGWRHNKTGMTADKVASYLYKMQTGNTGMAGLAIRFSLPYAMLLWSIITFAIAFVVLGVRATNLAAKVSFSVVFGLAVVLVGWSVLADTIYDGDEDVTPHQIDYPPPSPQKGHNPFKSLRRRRVLHENAPGQA